MNTTDTVFLGIAAIALALFFVLGSVLLVAALVLVKKVKKLVAKAEDAIDSVEAATETIKNIGTNARGPMAAFKLIKNIVNLVNRHK